MLVLSRKTDEEVIIGDEIRVTVLAIQGNKVRLGFTAPPHISIQRKELLERDPDIVIREVCAISR